MMDKYHAVLTLILLAAIVSTLGLWMLIGRDDEAPGPPPARTDGNSGQGRTEDEAWNCERMIH